MSVCQNVPMWSGDAEANSDAGEGEGQFGRHNTAEGHRVCRPPLITQLLGQPTDANGSQMGLVC